MRRVVLTLSAVAATTALLAPHASNAQTIAPLRNDGTLWNPPLSVDPDTLPHVEGTRMPGAWNWNAGAAVELLERPYSAHFNDASGTPTTTALIDYQLWTHYLVQLGLCPCLAIALDLPVLVSQSGDLTPFGQTSTGSVGFGDLRGLVRWTTRHHSTPRPAGANGPANNVGGEGMVNEGPGLGITLAVTAPTGEPRNLTGTGAWTVHPMVTGDLRLFGLILGAQVGYRARIDGTWPSQSGNCPAPGESGMGMSGMAGVDCLGQVPLRDQVTWSAGLRVPQALLFGLAAVYGEAYGAFDARNPGAPGTMPVEVGGGLQRAFDEVTVTLGAAAGITDSPGNPRVRGMLMVQWAPRFIDEDGDGLRDNTGEDQCPGLPEDRDGFQDNDGCPEDNDHDELPDAEDRCPNEDEDMDGFQDEDGCPDPDNDQDGVLDAQDQCPNVPMGASPDEHRPGCPSNDADGDGVMDAQDQCPHDAAGAHADPSRPGCPAPDRDHDGVPDADDACPDAPAGEGASAAMRGCAEVDRDHDGVLDAQDRCPDRAETINGVQDDDGCPEEPAPNTAHPRVRIVGASATAPGHVELLEPVHFTAHDEIARTSDELIAQLARAILATSRIPSHGYSVTVVQTPESVHGAAAVDSARATRRRDALIAALRAHGAPEWSVRPADPAPASAANDHGVVLTPVESRGEVSAHSAPTPASNAAPAASAEPASAAPVTPVSEPPASAAPASNAAPAASEAPASAAPAATTHHARGRRHRRHR